MEDGASVAVNRRAEGTGSHLRQPDTEERGHCPLGVKSREREWRMLQDFTCGCLSGLRCQAPGPLLGQEELPFIRTYNIPGVSSCLSTHHLFFFFLIIETPLWKDSHCFPILQMGKLELRGVNKA